MITECKLTRNNTTSIYRYTIVLSYICALIRSCIRSHTVVMLSGARRPCVHLGCVTPAARCKFYLQLPLGSSILSYHCERLTRQFGIVTPNSPALYAPWSMSPCLIALYLLCSAISLLPLLFFFIFETLWNGNTSHPVTPVFCTAF